MYNGGGDISPNGCHCWVGLVLLDSFVVWWWLLKLSTVVFVVEAHESPFLKLISWQPSNQNS
jgi:hypothetical protein